MKTSEDGRKLITKYEGVRNKPYRDAIGLWTVGVGHLIGKTLPTEWDRTFTNDEIQVILAIDLKRFEQGVLRYVRVPLSQNEFDALVSFSFNLGLGTLQRSSVRQKINRGDKIGAAASILKYNKAGGKPLRGLTRRRQAEYLMFMGSY